MNLLALMGAAALLAGCAPAQSPTSVPDESITSSELKSEVFLDQFFENGITYSVTPCYGTCASYSVNLFDDGVLLFRPDPLVRQRNDAAATEPRAILIEGFFTNQNGFSQLVGALESQGLLNLDENYSWTMENAHCATDHSAKYLEVRTLDYTKRVAWDMGCQGFDDEDALRTFFDFLEEQIGTADLISSTQSRDISE